MKKSAIVLLFSAFLSIAALAQNVQEGVNHFYAERYQSAKSLFEKLVSSNPKNAEAVYWLGQTLIATDDLAGARSVYENGLAANANAPLVQVGMGHVELMEGKANEARQRFETAISTSKGRKGEDPNILNAVGRANVDAYTEKNKLGDLDYAIAKLNAAAQLAPTNAEILLNLGLAYRKKHQGGQAITNYIKANQVNPNFAVPAYRTAMLYKTQQNWDIVIENLNKAIAADPKFAPAYLELYYYYLLYPKDFSKAEEYAKQYIANSDPSVENDYLEAQTKYVQKQYDQAINIGQNIITKAGEKVNPRVFRMMAYAHVEKGDTAGAKQYVDQFFAKAKEDDVIGADYLLHADVYAKNNPAVVKESYYKAAKMDSVLTNQVKILNEGIERFRKSGQKSFEADLRLLSYQLRSPNVNPAELFQIGLPYYQGGAYERADSVFGAYATAMPDSIYGHYWRALSLSQIDTTMEQGLAVPAFEKSLQIAETDKVRFKSQGLQATTYLAGYANNVKKDKETAIMYLKKALEFDPANSAVQHSLDILSKASTPKKPAGHK